MTVKISHYKNYSGGEELELLIHASGTVDVWWGERIVDKITIEQALQLINKELEPLLDAKKQLEARLDIVPDSKYLCRACGQPLTGCTNSDCDASIG